MFTEGVFRVLVISAYHTKPYHTIAHDKGLSAREFVESARKEHKLIAGIGHLVKSITNPDMRVTILKVRKSVSACVVSAGQKRW